MKASRCALGGALVAVLAASLAPAVPLASQSPFHLSEMGQAIFTVDQVDHTPRGGSLTEARIVQPVFSGLLDGWHGKVQITGTLDLEGLTMPGGELAPGDWGEGFVDRRHPHTYAHELNIAVNDLLGRLDGSGKLGIVLGKGFVPFGTDDPMSRPFLRYPVNHHLAQIAERAIGIVQYDVGWATVEGALFDGDEPTKPSDWPLIRTADGTWRFGDSRSLRLLLRPVDGLEAQGSVAHVHSPENRPGAGPDVSKVSASLRWDRVAGTTERYALVEWERSSELAGFFIFHSFLAEGMWRHARWSISYRFEDTERPEEVRLVDPFRTMRPSPDNSIIGISEWSLHTVHIGYDIWRTRSPLHVQPFAEGTFGTVAAVGGGIFDPTELYGTPDVRAVSVGLMVDWSMRGHRMGRYGALAMEPMGMMPMGMMDHR